MPATVEDLGKAVKQAHPGQFDDKDDRSVGLAVREAYPDQFKDVTDHATFGQRFSENIPHPIDMIKHVVGQVEQSSQAAKDAWAKGNHAEAAFHAMNALLAPVTTMGVGPAADVQHAVDTAQHLQNVVAMQQAAPTGSEPTQAAKQEALKAIPIVGDQLAGVQQDYSEGNIPGIAGSVAGQAATALLAKTPEIVGGVKTAAVQGTKDLIGKYTEAVAKPGGKNIVHGGITLAAAPVLYGMGHTIAGPLAFLRGSTQLLEGLGQAAREGTPELPKGSPNPFEEAQKSVSSPGASPAQATSEAPKVPTIPDNQGLDPKLLDQTAKNLGAKNFASITNDAIRKVVINGVKQKMIEDGTLPAQPPSIPTTQTPAPTSTSKAFTDGPGGHPLLGKELTPITRAGVDKYQGKGITHADYHPETNTGIVQWATGKKTLLPNLERSAFDEMINSQSPTSVFKSKIEPNYITQESTLRPRTPAEATRPPMNTPAEQVAAKESGDPMLSLLHDSLDAELLRTHTLNELNSRGLNAQEHGPQMQQIIRDAAMRANLERAARGKAPISQTAIDNVIKGFNQ